MNPDLLFMIFDAIIDTETTLIIQPNKKHHSIIGPLSQSCHKLRNEIKAWSTKRKDLIRSPTFGLFNPSTTTFSMVFVSYNFNEHKGRKGSRVWRIYSPFAAQEHLSVLELWQQAMDHLSGGVQWCNQTSVSLWAEEILKHRGEFEKWREEGKREVLWIDQHKKDGVRDVLVLDWNKYLEVGFPRAWGMIANHAHRVVLGWEEGRRAFVWAEDWEAFGEQRNIVPEDVVKAGGANVRDQFWTSLHR